jgi:AcrR family transcriptional regulator
MTVTNRRTQEERSATTRAALLDATIDTLVREGYAATTTTAIAERAGVSRGAQLHHYPTKADLVAAAIEHLATKLLGQFAAAIEGMSESERIDFVIDALWSSFSEPLLPAWVELSVAARTDTDLRRRLRGVADRMRDAIIERSSSVDALLVVTMTLCLLEGLSLERRWLAGGRGNPDPTPLILETWKRMVRAAFPSL